MELRVLKYFLTVARKQSISAAAQALHLSQPTLSRQLKELEDQLGKPLLIRGPRHVTLTEEGRLLRKRAEEILSLVQKATDEVAHSEESIIGDVYIGAGETDGVRYIAKAANLLQQEYPNIRIHIVSGDMTDVMEDLEHGLVDFALLFGPTDNIRYESLSIPDKDTFGVLMRRDSPLASKDFLTAEDLWDKPLIVNRNALIDPGFSEHIMHKSVSDLNIAATYTLLYNGSLMVEEGMGYAICLDRIININGDSNLCYRPIRPPVELGITIVWKRYQHLSKPVEKLLEKLQELYG